MLEDKAGCRRGRIWAAVGGSERYKGMESASFQG